MIDLRNYRKNIYSSNGEDGVIEKIFELLNINQGHFVEFGAWDGIYCSNTRKLAEMGFSGVYIEPVKERFDSLVKNTEQFGDRIVNFNCGVELEEGGNTLDSILSKTNIPKDFELLSIDTDAYDYQIWKGFNLYTPKVVIIEIDSSRRDGPDVIFGTNGHHSTSYEAMIELGISKGYKPICHIGNLIFLKEGLNFPDVHCYFEPNYGFN